MKAIKFPSKEILTNNNINKLIKVKTNKNPFKSEKESEDFYKNIIEEEMILSNDYNFANIEKLLNLYIKGINIHQKTLDTKEIYYFQEKINLLLNTPKAKSIINKEKKRNDVNMKNFSSFDDNNDNRYKIGNRLKNNNNTNILRSKTFKDNIVMNSFKLKALNQTIKKELEAKEYQKKKIEKINKELFDKNKSILLIEDDFKKQANNFQEKLLLKRKNKMNMSRVNKDKENNIININNNNKNKSLIDIYAHNKIINEEKEINLENNDDNNIIKNSLKENIYKYFDEYNESIYKYYFLKAIKKISELTKENISENMKINEEYQASINTLLKMQLDGNNIIDDEDINSIKEEQELEIQKNDDLFEKYIEDEISNFKLYGYLVSAPKELEMLKNKIKCEIYNNIYNILDK